MFVGKLHPYQEQDVAVMQDRKRVLVGYGQGCLTGDTIVTVNRRGKGYKLRLDELVHRWDNGPRSGPKVLYSDGETYVRSLLADGTLGRAQLVGVKNTGARVVWRLSLSTGQEIRATPQHEILTPNGKVALRELSVGDAVVVDSITLRTAPAQKPTAGWTLPDGRKTDKNGYVRLPAPGHPHAAADGQVFEHHVVAAEILGRWIAPGEEVHHWNGVRHDNHPDNLAVVTREEHLALHNFRSNLPGVLPQVARVTAVEYAGFEHVYDLSVADDAHTWVGNGVVVGNTGKTVMTIAAIEDMMDDGTIREPGLIICLASLKYQWEQAIRRWTGGTTAEHPRTGLPYYVGGTSEPLVIDGTAAQRAEQYKRAQDWRTSGVDYVILSYEQVVNDWNLVRRLPRGFVVCDEVSFIKGFRAKRSKRVKRLDAPIKFGLTGTPIENGKLEEFFSIMEWVDPEVLGRWDLFDKAFIVRSGFGNVQRYRNIPVFRKAMSQALVRRTRNDPEVAPFFPEVDNDKPPIVVPMDRDSRKLYRTVAQELLDNLIEAQSMFGSGWSIERAYGMGGSGDEGDQMRGRIAQKMMVLQMLCDHPELVRISAQKFEDVMSGKRTDGGSSYCAALVADGLLDKVTRTPKMDAATRWISERLEADERNKIVVFCTYVDTLHLFAQRFAEGQAVVFHGGMNARQKDDAMSKFKHDPTVRVFLSSDAGGYGVDLPEGNYLLNYSLPDKWGTTDQRETRIVRASSEFKVVTIMRIFIENAIEIRKHLLLEMKGKVASAFVDGKGYDRKGALAWDVDSLTSYLTTTLQTMR